MSNYTRFGEMVGAMKILGFQQLGKWITWVNTPNRNGTIPFVDEEKVGQFVHDLLFAPANTHFMGVNECMNPTNFAAFIGEASGLVVNYKGVS